MRTIDRELYHDSLAFFNKWTTKLNKLDTLDLDECIDAGYAIRETCEYLNDIRKTLEGVSKQLQISICIKLLALHRKKKATEHCTVTTNNKATATPPKLAKDPEKYYALMNFLKIPSDVSERELVRIHYPAFEKLCTELVEKGKCPPGIDAKDIKTSFGVSFRRKKGVLE